MCIRDRATADDLRKGLEAKHDDDIESIVTDERYQFIQKISAAAVKKGKEKMTVSDKIDRIVTNRILGIPLSLIHILHPAEQDALYVHLRERYCLTAAFACDANVRSARECAKAHTFLYGERAFRIPMSSK